jgi:hypothetical protein
VTPSTAALQLDGVALGAGPWTGRLPVGAHTVTASEPGYFVRTATFVEADPGSAPVHVTLPLDADPTHPRWPRRAAGQVVVDLIGSLALGRSLDGDAEAWCPGSCSRGPRPLGGLVGARAGFHFPFGLSLEVAGGYLTLSSSFTRSRSTTFMAAGARRSVTYDLADDLALRGPFVAGGVGFRVPLAGRLALAAHAMAGALIAGATDPIVGKAVTARGSAPVIVTGRGERLGATPPFVAPEVDLEARFGSLHLAAGLGAAFVLGGSAAFGQHILEVSPAGCSPQNPGVPACAPGSTLAASERAFRPFAVVLPTLTVGYAF